MNDRELVELFVLKFNDDGSFYGSLHDHEALIQLEDSVSQAKRSVQGQHLAPSSSTPGGLCLAPWGNNVWARAEIRSLLTSSQHGVQTELLFIDRGTTATVPLYSLLPLPLELSQYPPLSEKFHLRGVVPSQPRGLGVTWSEAAMTLLRRLCRTDGDSWIRVLGEIGLDGEVVLYCDTGSTQLDFNECLVTAQLAMIVQPMDPSLLDVIEVSALETLPSPPPPVRLQHQQQRSIVEKFLPHSAPKYAHCGVFVEGEDSLKPVTSLGASGLPPSVCKELASRGFRDPTPVQMYAWPCVASGQSALLVSPPSSGKTLAYVLPLIVALESSELAVSGGTPQDGPLLVVVVATSAQARSVHLQVKKIYSWISVAKTHRCVCSYIGAEAEATHQLINGVDVLVCTPPSLLRLLKSTATTLQHLRHLVLDDGAQLLDKFPSEVEAIQSSCRSIHNPQQLQVVVATSTWLESLETVFSIERMTKIFACSIEATLRAKVDMAVLGHKTGELDLTLLRCLHQKTLVVCVTSGEEARRICQVLQLHSWSAVCIVKKEQLPRRAHHSSEPMIYVIADEALPPLLLETMVVDDLLMYDLPSSKTAFRHRLTLLYHALHRGFKCSVDILLSERHHQQAPFLKKLLQRSGRDVPRSLEEAVGRALREKEKQQCNYDLCYYLKAWGYCNQPQCTAPHSMLTPAAAVRPQLVRVPRDGTVQVKVVHVSNATRIWVSLLQHSPLQRGSQPVPCTDPSVRVKLSFDLSSYYADPENKTLHENPSVGAYCGYEDQEGGYHRARILKFSQPLGLFFHHKEQARVRLIDVGSVHVVDVNQLLTLPAHLLAPPAQVLEVFVCRVRPLDGDQDWPEEAVMLSRRMLEGQVVYGNVALTCGETLWLDPIEQRFTLEGIGVSTALTRPQQELIKAGLAGSNPDHLAKLRQVLHSEPDRESQLSSRGRVQFASLQPPGGEQTEVFVTAVASPRLFFVLTAASESSLDAMESLLNAGQLAPLSTAGVPEGTICAAKYPLDSRWYRGEVVSCQEGQSEVFFVDYGNTDWVANNLIQPLDPKLEELPFQAIECSFSTGDFEWGSEAGDILWEWTRDATFFAKAIDSHPSSRAGMTRYVVELYDSDGTSVSQRLPKKGGTVNHVPSDSQDLLSAFLSECVQELSVTESRGDQLQLARRLQATVMKRPSLDVGGHDLCTVCDLLPRLAADAQLPLLRSLAGLAAFQECVRESLVESKCLDSLLPLLKAGSSGLLEMSLLVIKFVLPHESSSSVFSSTEWMSTFAHCLRECSSAKAVGHTVDILAALLSENRNLGIHLAEPEVVQSICQLLCQSGGAHHAPCLTLLNSILLGHHGGSRVIKQLLPLGPVCGLVDSEQEPEVVKLATDLLGKLCADGEYRRKVTSLLMNSNRGKGTGSGVKCMLQNDLWRVLGQGTKQPVKATPLPADVSANGDGTSPVASSVLGSPTAHSATNDAQQVLHPKVLWSQTKSHVHLAVQVRGCAEQWMEAQPQGVVFRAIQHHQVYGFSVSTYAKIVPEGCSDKVTGSEVVLKLQKEACALWPRLTERREKHPFLSLDFDHWTDSSSSSEHLSGKPHQLYTDLVNRHDDSSTSGSEDSSDSDNLGNDFMDMDI